jgi:choline dehydrogenase-like flavoprotein
MRTNPKVGETDVAGRLTGTEGVYVVDGACLPSLSEKSHTLTLMANADRIAKGLAERLSGEGYA